MSTFIDIIITIVVLVGFALFVYSGYKRQTINVTLHNMIEWFDGVGDSKDNIVPPSLNLGDLSEVVKRK